MHGLRPPTSGPAPTPRSRRRRRCPDARRHAGLRGTLDGVDRERAVGWPGSRWTGDRLLDRRRQAVLGRRGRRAACVADADHRRLSGARARRRARHARGAACSRCSSVSLWQGFCAVAARRARRGAESRGRWPEQMRMWGGPGRRAVRAAFTLGFHLDRGDSAAARTVAERLGRCLRSVRAAGSASVTAQLGSPRDDARRRSRRSTPTSVDFVDRQPGLEPWRQPGGPGAAPASDGRRGAGAGGRRRWRCSAAGVRRATSARRCGWPASCAAGRSRRAARGGATCSSRPGLRSSWPAPSRPRPSATRCRRRGDPAAAGGGRGSAVTAARGRARRGGRRRWPTAASGRSTRTGGRPLSTSASGRCST